MFLFLVANIFIAHDGRTYFFNDILEPFIAYLFWDSPGYIKSRLRLSYLGKEQKSIRQ